MLPKDSQMDSHVLPWTLTWPLEPTYWFGTHFLDACASDFCAKLSIFIPRGSQESPKGYPIDPKITLKWCQRGPRRTPGRSWGLFWSLLGSLLDALGLTFTNKKSSLFLTCRNQHVRRLCIGFWSKISMFDACASDFGPTCVFYEKSVVCNACRAPFFCWGWGGARRRL